MGVGEATLSDQRPPFHKWAVCELLEQAVTVLSPCCICLFIKIREATEDGEQLPSFKSEVRPQACGWSEVIIHPRKSEAVRSE